MNRMDARYTVALAALLSTLPACSEPRTPETVATADADGGDLSCDERMRAQALCQTAIRQRCESRARDCEAACKTSGPASNAGSPMGESTTFVADIDQTRCHDNCRQTGEGCVRSVGAHCPAKCD